MSHNLDEHNNLRPGDLVFLNYTDERLTVIGRHWQQRHKERHVCIVLSLDLNGYVEVYDTVENDNWVTKAENLRRMEIPRKAVR